MGLLSWLVVGLLAGWLAGRVVRGSGYGLGGDVVLGISGGLVGGYLAGALSGVPNALNTINLLGIAIAFVGAMFLVALSRGFLHPRQT